jgi:putative PIN family toxin of toxin-antitoxin system
MPRSTPRQALLRARKAGKILLSAAVLGELRDVLVREKLRRYADEDLALEFLSEVSAESEWVNPDREVVACRDPKDDKFLSLAVCGRATHLVTGDADLLALNPFEGIRIVTPRQFLEI